MPNHPCPVLGPYDVKHEDQQHSQSEEAASCDLSYYGEDNRRYVFHGGMSGFVFQTVVEEYSESSVQECEHGAGSQIQYYEIGTCAAGGLLEYAPVVVEESAAEFGDKRKYEKNGDGFLQIFGFEAQFRYEEHKQGESQSSRGSH